MQGGEAPLGTKIHMQAAAAARQLLARPINLLSLSKIKVRLAVGALPGSGHPPVFRSGGDCGLSWEDEARG